MNNYYYDNEFEMPKSYQRFPETMYRQTPRRVELDVVNAEEQVIGDGFFRYLWVSSQSGTVKINRYEYLDLRLNAKPGQQVISAGFASGPLGDISIVGIWPRYQNVMSFVLHSESSLASEIDIWLVVK